jgi:uncharacterized protein YjbI with pentapeptide repeats
MAGIGIVSTIVVALVVVIVLLLTGGGEAVPDNAALIGALLALGGVFTTQLVNIALEAQRAQDSALQAFLGQLSHSDTYRELRTAPASGHKRAILRAKMQTLLLQLDEERKGVLLSFLHGAKLSRKEEITPYEYTKVYTEGYTKKEGEEKEKERWKYPILRLDDIDFSRTKRTADTKLTFDDLRGIILRGADLSKVNLSGANLSKADLSNADLSGATLRKAEREDSETIPGEHYNEYDKAVDKADNFRSKAKLPPGLLERLLETDLSEADLTGADLSEADLRGADLRGADLRKADLSKANLSKAKVRKTDLSGVDLIPADLRGADLRGADLSGADLRGADLRGADLSGAEGITNEKLEQQAKSLKGAILPDGSKHP